MTSLARGKWTSAEAERAATKETVALETDAAGTIMDRHRE